ncbi:MAG: DUF4386 domain-containing protein [Actinomycetota bacterium]|nr:DUF4386 domain-containing protein [Actinomycetota bacterium]
MNSVKKTSIVLGIAFLLEFITNVVNGMVLRPALITTENITESMTNIANNVWLMKTYILVDVITALGIVFLGAVLFIVLKKKNEIIALVALGFYIIAAALLAVSRMEAFSLLRISQEYIVAGQPDYLQMLGNLSVESMDFTGSVLHSLVFSVGAILFYYLLCKSRAVPRALSLWGLITVPLVLIGTLSKVLGYELPFYINFLYVPFEFVIGIWLLVKGINKEFLAKE